jgi:thiamine phosphate synthase YjbQ (UPF0047 family)
MIERLYQPDFSCIFGKKFSNAFVYDELDTLVWPIFSDIDKSTPLIKLLAKRNEKGHPYFYHRNLSLEDLKVELQCAHINKVFLQAMNLGKEYGISNTDVVNVINKDPNLFKGILSFDLTDNSINLIDKLKEFSNRINMVGVSLYPAYTKLDLNDNQNSSLTSLLEYLKNNDLFLKIDLGNLSLPEYQEGYISKEIIQSFVSRYPTNIIVLSGLDISGDFKVYYQLLKYFRNLWLELEPRAIGGSTPTWYFQEVFKLQGFIQNAWHRIMIGSASPTLEMSQIRRGFWEATDNLPFSQKCLLRTWSFRNPNRINPQTLYSRDSSINPEKKIFQKVLNINEQKKLETPTELTLVYKIKMRSYSITQLLFLTDLLNNLMEKVLEEYPDYDNGELFLRSYHTTTSLIVNEHEQGNYLDFHYKFAELSREDSTPYFHTVSALENRADFNRYDHDLATMNGRRQIILPILDGNLEIGGRENFYVLVTFGPRTFHLFISIKLLKE